MQLVLEPEVLTDGSMHFCPQCAKHTASTRQCTVVSAGSVLILHIDRCVNRENKIVQDNRVVACSNESLLQLPICVDEAVSFCADFQVVATINHSGSARSGGHYWAFIYSASQWFMCNDASVTSASPDDISNGSSCLFFLVRSRK